MSRTAVPITAIGKNADIWLNEDVRLSKDSLVSLKSNLAVSQCLLQCCFYLRGLLGKNLMKPFLAHPRFIRLVSSIFVPWWKPFAHRGVFPDLALSRFVTVSLAPFYCPILGVRYPCSCGANLAGMRLAQWNSFKWARAIQLTSMMPDDVLPNTSTGVLFVQGSPAPAGAINQSSKALRVRRTLQGYFQNQKAAMATTHSLIRTSIGTIGNGTGFTRRRFCGRFGFGQVNLLNRLLKLGRCYQHPLSFAHLTTVFLVCLLSLACVGSVFSQARTADQFQPVPFSQLTATAPNGSVRYCISCQQTNPCVASTDGEAAVATKISGVWNCAANGTVSGVNTITGTANQVIANAPSGNVTLSLPQSIATSSNVAFGALGLTNDATVGGSVGATGTVSGSHLFMTNFLRGAEIAAPSVSASGTARLYPDSASHTWKVSSNGGSYFNLLTGATSLTTNNLPVATAINQLGNGFFAQAGDATNPVLNFGAADVSHIRLRDSGGQLQVQAGDGSSLTTVNASSLITSGAITAGDTITGAFLFTTGFMRLSEIAAPSVSSSGTARMYADSGFHTMRVSVNGGAYASMVLSSRSINTSSPLTGGSSLSGDITLGCATCVVAASTLTNNAIVTGANSHSAQTSSSATMDSSGNLVTGGTVTTAGVKTVAVSTNTASNTDLAGRLTLSGGGTASYTFAGTYASAPICTLSAVGGAVTIIPRLSASSTTAFTVTGDAAAVINYVCVGRN